MRTTKTYTVMDVSRYFLSYAIDNKIEDMGFEKEMNLIFLSQQYATSRLNRPVFNSKIVIRESGIFIPEFYDRYYHPKRIEFTKLIKDEEIEDCLFYIASYFCHIDNKEIIKLICSDDTPYKKICKSRDTEISNELLSKWFKEL